MIDFDPDPIQSGTDFIVRIPDIGFDAGGTMAEMGGKLGGDLVSVIGVGLAIFAAVFVVRALKRHANPA